MCITPLRVLHKAQRNVNQQKSIPVPCGKCPDCISRRTSAWSFRLMQEDKKAINSQFITLTYATEHVPISKNGFMSLNKADLQKFFKRLRKAHERSYQQQQQGNRTDKSDSRGNCTDLKSNGGQNNGIGDQPPIKYYAVGEYGGNTTRPHYHVIIFNSECRLIEKSWGMGTIYYGTVSGASVGYTLKYISKPKRIPGHRNDDREPEFAIMSKGLGASYINDKTIQYHQADLTNRMCLNLEEGKKASMPRYYKQKIYTEEQRKQIGLIYKTQHEYAEQLAKRRYQGDYDRDKTEYHKEQFKKLITNAKKDKT